MLPEQSLGKRILEKHGLAIYDKINVCLRVVHCGPLMRRENSTLALNFTTDDDDRSCLGRRTNSSYNRVPSSGLQHHLKKVHTISHFIAVLETPLSWLRTFALFHPNLEFWKLSKLPTRQRGGEEVWRLQREFHTGFEQELNHPLCS